MRDFQTTMPIVKALGNRLLEDYHWAEIKELLGADELEYDLEEKQFTLGELIKLEVGEKQDEVVDISTTATQESKLRESLTEI